MGDHGVFDCTTHRKYVPHGLGHAPCTMHGTFHDIRVSRGLVHGCTMEHAMVYSMVPDDASVDLLSMGLPTNKVFQWYRPWSPMARSI